MKKLILRGVILFSLSVFCLNLPAQSQRRVEKTVENRAQQLEKQEEDKKKQAKEEMEARRQKHIDMQTKKVQKRMKKNKKKSRRINENKKEFFLKRWFN